MTVHELGGIAYGVGRNGELPLLIQLAGRKARADDLKAELREDGMPQRIELIHTQRHRQTDLLPPFPKGGVPDTCVTGRRVDWFVGR